MRSIKIKHLITIVLALSLSFSLYAFEKVGVTSFQFLKVTPDARSAAMGNATSSLNTGIYSMYTNPANLVDNNGLIAEVSYLDYLFDTQHQSLAVNWTKNNMSFGLFYLRADYGEIEETTVEQLGYLSNGEFNPGLTGNVFRPGAQVIGFSFSQRLTDKFSYGVITKYVHEEYGVCAKGIVDVGCWITI